MLEPGIVEAQTVPGTDTDKQTIDTVAAPILFNMDITSPLNSPEAVQNTLTIDLHVAVSGTSKEHKPMQVYLRNRIQPSILQITILFKELCILYKERLCSL